MPAFVAYAHGPVLTLLFANTIRQHSALARIEAFYESESAGKYLSCEEAAQARICKGYEAFNLPTDALRRWLNAMKQASPRAPEGEEQWWTPSCNAVEDELLRYIFEHDLLESTQYVVSALIPQAETSLAHERLHALYALSERYRALVHRLWDDLPKAAASAISLDLKMRGYSEAVWPDEFGAYLGVRVPTTRKTDPALEFGKKNADVCHDVRVQLLAQIPAFWEEDVGVSESAFVITPAQLDEARAVIPPHKETLPVVKKGTKKRR